MYKISGFECIYIGTRYLLLYTYIIKVKNIDTWGGGTLTDENISKRIPNPADLISHTFPTFRVVRLGNAAYVRVWIGSKSKNNNHAYNNNIFGITTIINHSKATK